MGVAYLEKLNAEQRRAVEGHCHGYASHTGFIPAAVMKHFECVASPPGTAETGGLKDARQVRIDIGAKMRGMWR
jgi:DNA helicase II / ATP-dependent DNA helicase PcrA